ncbi:mycothione reductase [Actinospica durhamensis]|uniref:Mycothione reductase n=1 Tax=Actinospica durhamensis TaxID=1508375 RepID=A0A941ERH2_9ACTN|nr:mycothione reductase [Actinospica durhamensis]MBR7835761.1 mycothione reductase [Actinospica durhamensis]
MRHHDLIVLGAGSGAAVIEDSFADLDVALVADGPVGGTCLNAGCIPSKMLSRTAEVVEEIRDCGGYDVDAELRGMDWSRVRARVFGRLDAHRDEARSGLERSGFVTVYPGRARFTGPRRLRVELPDGPTDIEADQVVIAAGARPVIPPVVADSGVHYETSDTIMRIARPPRRLAVLGGGYIAAELAQVFASAGSDVVIVEQAETLLGSLDESLAGAYTRLAAERFELRLGRELTRLDGADSADGPVELLLDDGSRIAADVLLVAVGRTPNSDRLDLAEAGVDVHEDGRIAVDAHQRTSAEGVWALGDVCAPVQLKHVANRQARIVAHNLRHPNDLRGNDHDVIPAAVFTRPQIATVGRTERQCRDAGLDYAVGTARYADVAYGWALEDETGFCKVLAERGTGRLLGAHILGAEAPTLIQPLVLAMTVGIDARTLATAPYWIHPALTEVVENALLALDG